VPSVPFALQQIVDQLASFVGLAGGDDVLVTGAGPVGLLAAASARALGAGSVTVTDLSDFRLELARGMGFETERSDEPGDGRRR